MMLLPPLLNLFLWDFKLQKYSKHTIGMEKIENGCMIASLTPCWEIRQWKIQFRWSHGWRTDATTINTWTVVRHNNNNNNNGQDFSKKRRKLNFSHNCKQQLQHSQPQVVQPQVEEEDAFAPLDPNKPDEARRMQQHVLQCCRPLICLVWKKK